VGDDGTDTSEMLASTKPNGDLQRLLVDLLELDSDMLEVTFEGSTGTSDLDNARLNLNSH